MFDFMTFGFDADFGGYDRAVSDGVRSTSRLDTELEQLAASARAADRALDGTAAATKAEAAAADRAAREADALADALKRQARSAAASERASKQGRDELGRFTASSRASAGGVAALSSKALGLYAAAGVVAVGLARATRSVYTLGSGAEETESKFAAVFGPGAERLDATLAGLANTMGLTQTEARGLASTSGAVVQGLGVTQDAAAGYSEQIVRLSGDIASFSNVQGGAEQVSAAITSAITGEREALKTLGIVVSENDVKRRQAIRAAEGHADAMTGEGKVAATLELITERAGAAVGDLDRTKGSLANRTRYLTAVVKEEAERFARGLVPAMKDAVTFTIELFERSRGLASFLTSYFSNAIVQTIGDVMNVVDAFAGLFATLGDIVRAFGFTGSSMDDLTTTKVGPLTFALGAVAGIADVTAQALFGIAEATLYVAEKGARLASFMAAVQQNVGASASFAVTANNLADALDRLEKSRADHATQRAAHWANRFADRASDAADSTGDGATSAGALAEAFERAGAQASGASSAADKTKKKAEETTTELQEQEATAKELAATYAYLQSEEGKRALRIAAQNERLERQIEILREGVAIQQGRALATIPTAADSTIASQDENGLTVRPTAAPPVEDVDAADGIADSATDGASQFRTVWAGALDYLHGRFGELPKVADNALGRVVSTSAAFASAAGDSFGLFAEIAADAYQATGEEAGAAFEVQKAFLIGQAIAQTYQSAVASYASLAGIPVVGPALGAVAAAAAVAAGIANVAKIKAAKPGGSGGGSASYSAPSTSASAGSFERDRGRPSRAEERQREGGFVDEARAADRRREQRERAREQRQATAELTAAARSLREDGVRVAVEGRIEYDSIRLQEKRGEARLDAEGATRRTARGVRRRQ